MMLRDWKSRYMKYSRGALKKKLGQTAEVVFQRLFVEGNAGKPEEIIFEVVQIPGNGLPVETAARIALFVIQIAPRFHLETGKHFHHFAIGFHHGRGNAGAVAILGEEFEQRRVPEIFFEVGALALNLRHRFPGRAR